MSNETFAEGDMDYLTIEFFGWRKLVRFDRNRRQLPSLKKSDEPHHDHDRGSGPAGAD